MDDMQTEYDFSKGERGKFHIPSDQIRLPHYLTPAIEQNLTTVARRSGKTPDEVLQIVLSRELDFLEKLAQ